MEKKLISVVVPVFNSSATIAELGQRIHTVFGTMSYSYELILVDDGSSDDSWQKIEKLKEAGMVNVKAIRLSKNFGQHNALLCGFNFCSGESVLTMDDDLQHPPEEIPKIIEKFEGTNADVVYGMPIDRKHSSIRRAGSYFVRSTSEHSTEKLKGGSSFRLIKRSLTDTIKNNHNHNFLFMDAILGWYTGNFASVDVKHDPRKAGKSGYTIARLFYTYLDVLINYSAGPLKILTYGGLISSIISFILGLRFLWRKLIYNVPLGYTSLIVSILFSTSLILLCLGIIGQYLYKMYQLQNKRPPYSIDKQIS
jgi:glycosyltransferase involved in cell wall biosynthesis